jgi:hypothetical protein
LTCSDNKHSHFTVSEKILSLPADSKYMLSFKKAYDAHFADFKEKLMLEYEGMRGAYTSEIEQTLKENHSSTTSNLQNVQGQIFGKEIDTENLVIHRNDTRKIMNKLFDHKQDIYLQRVAFKAWLEYKQLSKREKRLEIYAVNRMYRKRMRLLFTSWRGVTHEWFK